MNSGLYSRLSRFYGNFARPTPVRANLRRESSVGSGGDAAGAFDHSVPIVDIAVERMRHDLLHPGLGIGGDARCSASAADVAVAQVAAAGAVFEVVGL